MVTARIFLPCDLHAVELERVQQTQLRQFFGRGHGADHQLLTPNRLLEIPYERPCEVDVLLRGAVGVSELWPHPSVRDMRRRG